MKIPTLEATRTFERVQRVEELAGTIFAETKTAEEYPRLRDPQTEVVEAKIEAMEKTKLVAKAVGEARIVKATEKPAL